MAKIEEGELAIRLTSDITGGLGNQSKGTVLRHLSESAFISLRDAGGHEELKAGTDVRSDVVEPEDLTGPTVTRDTAVSADSTSTVSKKK